MTTALVGFLGVILGALLNGLIAYRLEHVRRRAGGVAAARLVKHELVLCLVDFDMWVRDGHDPPEAPIATPMWDAHKHTLARVLATPEWDMIAVAYQWIDLYSEDPLYDREWWSDALFEMHGGPEALGDYLDGHSERKLRKLRQIGWQERRQQRSVKPAAVPD